MGKVITVHSLAHAMAAAKAAEAAGLPLTIRSALGGGGNVGVGWFAALSDLVRERHPGLDLTLFIDCGHDAGTAMGALRRGLNVIFVGHHEACKSLADVAGRQSLNVVREIVPDLDLLDVPDPVAACQALLGGAS